MREETQAELEKRGFYYTGVNVENLPEEELLVYALKHATTSHEPSKRRYAGKLASSGWFIPPPYEQFVVLAIHPRPVRVKSIRKRR